MEQNADAGMPMTSPAVENKQKNENGLKIATAIACVVAVCGIGFGVYGMIQSSQKDTQITDLKVQIKEKDESAATIETSGVETTTDTAIVSSGPYIKNGYFYVPEWGVKYKLSDELTDYGYAVNQKSMWHASKDNGYAVSLTGIKKTDVPSGAQAQTLDDIFTCSMILMQRVTKDYADEMRPSMPTATFVDYNNYAFLLSNETGYVGSCNVNKESARTASEIILDDVLSHPEAI